MKDRKGIKKGRKKQVKRKLIKAGSKKKGQT